MEYVLTALASIIISGGAMTWREKKVRADVATDLDLMSERIESVERRINELDVEVAKKVVVTLSPIAKAVKELQTTLGV